MPPIPGRNSIAWGPVELAPEGRDVFSGMVWGTFRYVFQYFLSDFRHLFHGFWGDLRHSCGCSSCEASALASVLYTYTRTCIVNTNTFIHSYKQCGIVNINIIIVVK